MTSIQIPCTSARLRLTAAALVAIGGLWIVSPVDVVAPAFAQEQDGGGRGPQAGSGGSSGGHEDGHDSTDHDDGHESGGGGHDSGGGHEDGEGHEDGGGQGGHNPLGGQQGGRQEDGRGTNSGLPPWAREGIPEVELGRLNAARSPDRVIDRALDEAKSNFTAEVAAFYRLDLNGMINQLSSNWDGVEFIDSPLQNLALLKDSLDGQSVLSQVGITTDVRTLQAVFLGTASDKEIPITEDTALAISVILGQPLSAAEARALASDAEKIRAAILAGHG